MVNRIALVQISKYVVVSLVCYFLLFIALWIFRSILNLSEFTSFIYAYGLVYIFDFYLTLKKVFIKSFRISIFIRYILYILLMYLLSIGLFYLTKDYFNIYNSTIVVILLLFPIRFFCSKYFVYT